MCDTNFQHERQLVKTLGHNTDKNVKETSCLEKYSQIKVEIKDSY